jgi:GNAT superfamily N-acetyltransferase
MIAIELLTSDDGEALAELYQELSGNTTDFNKMKPNLSWIIVNQDYYLIGAKNQKGELVGSVMGIMCRDIVGSCRPFMVLENVIVSTKYRGRGIGSQLLKRIENIAQERNCYYIMFVSSYERKVAHKFYESLGYKLDVVQGFKKYLPE